MAQGTLFLTEMEENRLLKGLELADVWKIEREINKEYETDEELKIRYSISNFQHDPAIAELAKQLQDKQPTEGISLEKVPEHLLPDFFFTIGARGVSLLIAALLSSESMNQEELEAIASLTQIRHEILIANESQS